MAKYKTKIKNHILIVKAKLSLKESMNEREWDSFTRQHIRGLLKAKLIKKKYIEYMGPVGISLKERMKSSISKHDFFFIIEQIVDVTQKVSANNMNVNYIVFDMDNVYINETTKEMQFIYLPITEMKSRANIVGFIENIIYSIVQAKEEDSDYISKFTYFLKGLNGYNPNEIEKYILKEDRTVVHTIKRYMPKDKSKENDDEGEETGLLQNIDISSYFDEEETGLLNPDANIHYASLYRILTEETIFINKPVFRIGKERSYSDYFVSNNDKVSRSHADIITRSGRYFIKDLNSRNRTFKNGQVIPVQQEIEIFDGDNLKLANEEFIFHV